MVLENIIEICVAIDIAILSIAYPIIGDKSSNIGEKFKSQYIPELFNQEVPQKSFSFKMKSRLIKFSIFKLILYLTLFSLLFLILNFPPLFDWSNWFINNSAKLIVLSFSITLTIFFFIWLDKVVLYNGKATSLLSYLIKRYDFYDNNSIKQEYHLKAINELTFYAIENQDEHLQQTLIEFYYKVFTSFRRNHDESKPLVYPVDLYFLVNKLNIEAGKTENEKLKAIEHRAVSGTWLLGEDFEEIPISNETYKWLWRNVSSICDKPRLIKMFWGNSSQYFDYQLKPVYSNHIKNKNKEKSDGKISREVEREEFLEFHYAIGGLLIYRRQYQTLKYMLNYSQSQPPKYPLLPDSMTEIFEWFVYFSDEFNAKEVPIDIKYHFPELDNLGIRRNVSYWICYYFSVLFIRQYSLHKYYTFQDFTGLPTIPDKIVDLKNWLSKIDFFKKCLTDALTNEDLILKLGFEKIKEEKRVEFNEFLPNLKEEIKEKIGRQRNTTPLSKDKVEKFYRKTNEIITAVFHEYSPVFNSNEKKLIDNDRKDTITGGNTLMSKSAFIEGDVDHLNYDDVFAGVISHNKIKKEIPNSFSKASTTRYLLNTDNIITGLRRAVGNSKDVLIIGFNLEVQLSNILENSEFKNHLKLIPSTSQRNTLFVIKKSDCPILEHKPIPEKDIEESSLIEINQAIKLYASVIDLSLEDNLPIKNKWNIELDEENLDFKVQLAIQFLSVIHWKKGRKVLKINISSRFKEQGIESEINDIRPLKEN